MKARDIITELEKKYPVSIAESWDNPGLLVGDDSRDVTRIYITLDVTRETLKEAIAWKAEMIISHHPMIFAGIKQVNTGYFIGEKILELAENKITYYAMHTNFDVCGMARINGELLGLTDMEVLCVTTEGQQGIGRIGDLPRSMTLGECALYVKECFALPTVKVFGEMASTVTRVAVSGGSGKSMVDCALASGAQVLITGDIDHHTGIDAIDQSLAVIDAGHYGTEYFFMEQIAKDLEHIDKSLIVKCAKKKFPYSYV